MGSHINYIDVSPDEIVNAVTDIIWKKIVSNFINLYESNGKKYKVTGNYSIHVNNKGKLSINISTREFYVQIRIHNQENLYKLDEYSENIRNQILNAPGCPVRCRPNDGIPGNHGEYVFEYHGKEYRKCKSWEANFRFYNINDDDIDSLISIAQREIQINKTKKS